jgi:hypothetical protein
VSIGGISTKKLNYSLRTIQPLSELNANSKELTFIQAGIASYDPHQMHLKIR